MRNMKVADNASYNATFTYPQGGAIQYVKALASEKRLLILEWLRDPEAHFPAQRDGDLVRDGVCSLFIADKLGVSQPTCGEHLKVLSRAGLIRAPISAAFGIQMSARFPAVEISLHLNVGGKGSPHSKSHTAVVGSSSHVGSR